MINVYECILVYAILEFTCTCRYSKQNMLLGGLWYDVAKPTMTTFLYPLMSCLNQLYNEGTVVITIDSYNFLNLTYIVTLHA